MDLIDALKTRKSIRGFKSDPVTKDILSEIIDAALGSPSAMNTQPWEVHVVSGEILKSIGEKNIEMLTSGSFPAPEVPGNEKFIGDFKKRQVGLAIQLFKLMGIAKEDQAARFEWMQRGFRFFGAPAAMILTYDGVLEPACLAHFDLGSLTHAICLTALKYDLGTCIHGQGIMYPKVIREHIEIPDTKKIFIAISIGYPDWDFAANKVQSDREPVDAVTTWHGF